MNSVVVFTGVGQVEIQSTEMPMCGPGQMLVRTTKTAISTGTELTILSGDYPEGSNWARYGNFPFNVGYSHVGEVVEIGEGVEGVAVGDRVAGGSKHMTHVVVTPASVHRIPDDVDDETATLWQLGRIACNGVRRASLQMGEAVVVYGLGIIGQLVCQWARLDGARPIIGVDLSDSRREFAERLGGATMVIDGADEDILEQVEAATRGRKADCVFEVTGVADLIPREMELLRKQGRIIILSSPRGKTTIDLHDQCNGPSLSIIGAHNGSHPAFETPYNMWTPARNTELFFDLVAAGELRVSKLITHRYNWSDAPEAYLMLLADRTQAEAVILDWTE